MRNTCERRVVEMHRDKALVENTRDWIQDNVRFAVDGAPPPWRIDLIANPQYVPAADVNFMREDDYIIGISHRGMTKAYPLWIVDYYHTIHDRIDDEPFVVFS